MAGAHEAELEAYAARDSGRLLGFAVLLAGDRQDAEDLVQLALLTVNRGPTGQKLTVITGEGGLSGRGRGR